jgi:2-dehydropantoate 2-reductase
MPVYAKYCIVGGGAVGSVLAFYLSRGDPGQEIAVFYRRSESVKAVERTGGILVEFGGGTSLVRVRPLLYTETGVECGYVINAVKAVDVPSTLDLMRSVSRSARSILMVQNGFGSLELAEEAFPDKCVAAGVVYFGAERVRDDYVKHTGGNSVVVGSRRGGCGGLVELAESLRRGGCDVKVVDDIDFYRWLKLGLNSVVNPLTAIARAKNKVVLLEEARPLVEMILSEVVEAARLHGVSLDKEKLLRHVLNGARATGENYSSMAQDLMRGRRTEVDYINGFVARTLESAGWNISVNKVITLLIHMIEGWHEQEGHS